MEWGRQRKALVLGAVAATGACWWWWSSKAEEAVLDVERAKAVRVAGETVAEVALESPSKERRRPYSVTQLFVYPVKSLRGVAVGEAEVVPEGLAYDRRWMVVDENGSFLSQRRVARMALLSARVVRDPYGQVAVELGGDEAECSILVPIDTSASALRPSPVRVWDDYICDVHDQGENAARWLARELQMPGVRLVYMGERARRPVSSKYAVDPSSDRTWFSDGFPMLLISQASLNDLNRRVFAAKVSQPQDGQVNDGTPTRPFEMDSFRPNIVIGGCEPYEEDNLDWVVLAGGLRLRVAKPCSRCKITTIDPKTGAVPSDYLNAEPLRTLRGYRSKGEDVFFGQNLIWDHQGRVQATIRVGDTFEVERRQL